MTKNQQKISLIENAESLGLLVSTVILQSDSSIYLRIKNVDDIVHDNDALLSFLIQQGRRSINQFWKQSTTIPYSLFFAVKKNSFIHSKFPINFLCTFLTKTKQYFSTNHIIKMTNFDQSKYGAKFSKVFIFLL